MKKIIVLDYGSGNLRSAQRALERVGARVEVTADPDAALDCDGLAVPGVGAFAACMTGLRAVASITPSRRASVGARESLIAHLRLVTSASAAS